MMEPAIEQNILNQATWATAESQRDLDGVRNFTDPGERAAMELVFPKVRGTPILDLGVGTGRTIPMLAPLASDYRGLDYSPAMVELSRERFPNIQIDHGDARDLSGYPAGHFGLVNFAFNGIDAVPAADRKVVLREVRRVLKPGGLFVFSALNIDGPSFRERPWRIRLWPTKNPLRIMQQVMEQVVSAPVNYQHWRRIKDLGEIGPGYAVAPLSAHHYGVIVHYTKLERQLEELASEGYEPDAIAFESRRGDRVSPGDDTHRVDWFHFVARRAPFVS